MENKTYDIRSSLMPRIFQALEDLHEAVEDFCCDVLAEDVRQKLIEAQKEASRVLNVVYEDNA